MARKAKTKKLRRIRKPRTAKIVKVKLPKAAIVHVVPSIGADPRVVKVTLPPTGIVRIVAPPGVSPVVVPTKDAVVIAPFIRQPKKKQAWWESWLYGSQD